MMRVCISIFILITGVLGGYAQDDQFRGPGRNGIFPEEGLLKEWPEEGPELLWVTEGLGKSFSSVVAGKGKIYTTGKKDSIEYLTALDREGNILWQKPYGLTWNQSFPEARCTPALDGDRIYLLSGRDQMACLHAETGKEIWSVDIHRKYESVFDMFGVSESPLLVDDKVIVSPCGKRTTIVALDKMTGETAWESKSLDTPRSNISPALIEHCGSKYIISGTQTHVVSVEAESGELMWTYHYNVLDSLDQNQTILTNVPTYSDSCLWITGGWDVRSVMLEIAPDGRSVTEKYTDATFDNQNHGVVLIDGFLYGSNFTGRNDGKWVCMNWDSGEIVWIGDFQTKGPVIAADSMLYIMDERRGNVGLVKADPEKFELVSSFRVKGGSGPFWSRPAIHDGVFYVRHGEVLIAYDIREKKS